MTSFDHQTALARVEGEIENAPGATTAVFMECNLSSAAATVRAQKNDHRRWSSRGWSDKRSNFGQLLWDGAFAVGVEHVMPPSASLLRVGHLTESASLEIADGTLVILRKQHGGG
jgi:hypothetical protein